MTDETYIEITGKSFPITRLTLRGWAQLESIKKEMDDAVSENDHNKYYSYIVKFIETALSVLNKIDWDAVPWYETLTAYSKVIERNSPTIKFPILIATKQENKKLPWEYAGRSWFFWLHLLASNYGWNEDKIGELDIDTALGLYQEILLDEQLHREWQWGLSEIAYPYSASSKKQEYKALDRPEWMLPIAPTQLPVVRIRKELMPIGQQAVSKKDNKRGI